MSVSIAVGDSIGRVTPPLVANSAYTLLTVIIGVWGSQRGTRGFMM